MGHSLRGIPTFLLRRRLLGLVCSLASAGATLAATAPTPRMLLLDAAIVGTDIVAVGERGTILRSSDQALSWKRFLSPTRATLTGISFAPAIPSRSVQHGWSVGHDATILATTDAGRSWVRQFQGENIQDSFLDVLALDEHRVIAIGAYALYFTTTDGGRTWVKQKAGDDDPHFNRITRGPSGTLYIAGERGTLLRSADAGANWTRLKAPYNGSFYGVMPLDRRTLVAHGLRGHIFRSVDDGVSWQPVAAPEPVLLAAGAQLRSNFLVLAGQARTLLVSRDYGKSFVAVEAPPTTGLAELLELEGGGLLALGEAGVTLLPAPR